MTTARDNDFATYWNDHLRYWWLTPRTEESRSLYRSKVKELAHKVWDKAFEAGRRSVLGEPDPENDK